MSNCSASNHSLQLHELQKSSIDLSPSQIILFSRINNHLLFHFIPLIQFWKTHRLCVTIDQFQKMLQNIKFKAEKIQLDDLKMLSVEFISLDRLLEGVNQWKKKQIDLASFIQKQNNAFKQEKQALTNRKRTNSNYQGPFFDINNRNQLRSERQSQKDSVHSKLNSRITNATHGNNGSSTQHYLVQKSKKQHEALLNLNQTLIRTNNQSHYQIAIKIGELNDICKKLKNDLNYSLSTKKGQTEILEKSKQSNQPKLISQKFFERKYQQLKLLSNNVIQQTEGTLEKDLRQTLVEVMYLSDSLKKQISLLKRKGVNS